MKLPLYGAKYAVIGKGKDEFMPRILVLTASLQGAKKSVENSGWENDPTVGIYELKEVVQNAD